MMDRGKRSKTLSEVKPFENISKNLQSFLEINPCKSKLFWQISFCRVSEMVRSVKFSTL